MNQQPLPAVYVGDLAPDVTDNMLFEMFKRVGTIQSIRICRDSNTNRSLGYAYVNFLTIDEAQRAIDTFNNTEIKGRPCRIMFSNRDPSARKNGVGNIFIANLDTSISSKELYDTFSQFGNILSCKVIPRDKSKAIGYVHFEQQESAERAISIVNGKKLGDNIVYVNKFIPRHERQRHIEKIWTNVYIKNLPPSVDSDEKLKQIFDKVGETSSCRVMKNLSNDTPLGFGYVCFVRHEDAVKAVTGMTGTEIDGNVIECERFKTKGERQIENYKIRESAKRKRLNEYVGKNLYVKNLEDNVTEELLRKEFEEYGKVTSIRIEKNDAGVSKGFGYVCFSTKEEAQNAINACGKTKILEGCTKPLYVNLHEPKENRIQRIISRPKKNMYNPYQNGPVLLGLPPWSGYGYGGNQRAPMKSVDHRQGNPQSGGGRGGGPRNQHHGGPRNQQQGGEIQNQQQRKPKQMTGEDRQNQGNAIFAKLKMMGVQEDDALLVNFVGAVISSQDFNFAQAERFLKDENLLLGSLDNYKTLLASQKQN